MYVGVFVSVMPIAKLIAPVMWCFQTYRLYCDCILLGQNGLCSGATPTITFKTQNIYPC